MVCSLDWETLGLLVFGGCINHLCYVLWLGQLLVVSLFVVLIILVVCACSGGGGLPAISFFVVRMIGAMFA